MLALICAAVVLTMTTWFSATAITPELITLWNLTPAQATWLTNAVQLGFVTGAILSSLINLPDILPLRKLMAISALIAAICNLNILYAPNIPTLLLARFFTGVALAGIYPPALKLVSTWFLKGRGTALGLVIAALTTGSALPHLLRFLTNHIHWQSVVIAASSCTLLGSALIALFAAEGPYPFSRAKFNPRSIAQVLRNRPLLLANLGYLGHMWELYAMWATFLIFTRNAHLALASPRTASLITFIVIASGALGAILGGLISDRTSRTTAASIMLAISGACALTIGLAFHGPLALFLAIAILWGITIVGDSAQFSALATELSHPSYVGTALALQLGLGFALTLVSIRLTPILAAHIGWQHAFAPLAIGPLIGLIAMLALHRKQKNAERR